MAKKRKLDSTSDEQQQQEAVKVKAEEQQEGYEDQEEEEGTDEYEEEYEEVEEEDDDVADDDADNNNNRISSIIPSVAAAAASSAAELNDDDEPVQMLLEPFGKEQLINLLREAAKKHPDVADQIRRVANADPAHRKIFVHGLGWDTNADTLTDAFRQYGEIEDCKAVCDKISGKSKGYGFIVFKSRSGARRALKEPQKKIGTRMTACQLASIGPVPSPAAAVAAPVLPAQQQQPQPPASEYTQKKIYVSNVGAELDSEKLLTFFSKYGEIEEGPLGLDKLTGKPKGFCLFVYTTVESAKKALEEPHKVTRILKATFCTARKRLMAPNQTSRIPIIIISHKMHNNSTRGTTILASLGPQPAGAGHGHLMAPSGPGIPFNHAAATQALNPGALGQALTALLTSQGAGLGLTNMLGTLSTAGVVNPAVPGATHGIQGGYGNQGLGSGISPGVMGGYGNQVGYQNQQQMGQGGPGWSQHGGQVGGYMGH